MQEESSDELAGIEGHYLVFVTVRVVAPAEGDPAVLQFQDAVIADGHPVGVPAQILKCALGAVKRWLTVYDPSAGMVKTTWKY